MSDFTELRSKPSKQGVYRQFAHAREYARGLGLTSSKQWRALPSSSIPRDIPRTPSTIPFYKDDWKGWGDWLGYDDSAPIYKDFESAREFARSLRLQSSSQWERLRWEGKLPKDIPGCPPDRYRDSGWLGWSDWLGGWTTLDKFVGQNKR